MKVSNLRQAKGFSKRQGTPAAGTSREAVDEDDLDRGRIDHVLGMTVFSNSSLACHSDTGLVAYPAGSVLILLDCLRNRQVSSIHTPRKMITAVCFSPDGKLIATGESGHQPSVRVWRLSTMSEIATLNGHHVGISCVSFTQQMSAIVVVGDVYDMVISVWSWPDAIMLSLNKFGDKVCAMDISSDGNFFVTVGNRHVKFYCMEILKSSPLLISNGLPIPLPTRVGTLDNFKDNYFCDVACGLGKWTKFIYVLSSTGFLCQMNRDRVLERWVNINVAMATCLARDEEHIFAGCDGGLVRMFRASDLNLILTLPRPHSLGLDIAQITDIGDPGPESRGDCLQDPKTEYPTVRAMAYDSRSHQLTVIYDDRSIYIWRRKTRNCVHSFWKCYSSLYHCGCIWDLTLYPLSEESCGGALPPGALISVSADGTLRAWDVASIISEKSMLKRNAVSTNCLKIVYSEADKETGRGKAWLMKRLRGDPMSPAFQRECRQSFGVVAVCSEGLHIATGNRCGRVMVYDAHSMKLVATRFAHDTEITALSYTATNVYKILASGSRDRMIHLMDASNDYQLLSTLDDHSSSITTIQFTYIAQCLLMVSSSLDMSVLVRAYLDNTPLAFSHVRAIVEKKAVMDFTMHPWSGQIALVCQDKLVRIYSLLNSQKSGNSYKGCPSQGGSLTKICMDPSGQYILTACTNKTINLIEFNTGEILHTFCGHAESITRIRFSHNLRHVISSASDGCIFMWKLPQTVAYSVKRVMAEMGLLTRGMVLNKRWAKCSNGKNVFCSAIPSSTQQPTAEAARLDATHNSKSHSVPILRKEETGGKLVKKGSESLPASDVMFDNQETTDTALEGAASKKTTENLDKTMKKVNPLLVKKDRSHLEWLQNCTQRRQLFKVEAKSIKRILLMMRLVADAMERDLIDAAASSVSDDMSLLEALEDETNASDNRIFLGARRGPLGAHLGAHSFVKKSPPRGAAHSTDGGRCRPSGSALPACAKLWCPTLSKRERSSCVKGDRKTPVVNAGRFGAEKMTLPATDFEDFITTNKASEGASKWDVTEATNSGPSNRQDSSTHETHDDGCAEEQQEAAAVVDNVSERPASHGTCCGDDEEGQRTGTTSTKASRCGKDSSRVAHSDAQLFLFPAPDLSGTTAAAAAAPPHLREKKEKGSEKRSSHAMTHEEPADASRDSAESDDDDSEAQSVVEGSPLCGAFGGGKTADVPIVSSRLSPNCCDASGNHFCGADVLKWESRRRETGGRPDDDPSLKYSPGGKTARRHHNGGNKCDVVSRSNAMPDTRGADKSCWMFSRSNSMPDGPTDGKCQMVSRSNTMPDTTTRSYHACRVVLRSNTKTDTPKDEKCQMMTPRSNTIPASTRSDDKCQMAPRSNTIPADTRSDDKRQMVSRSNTIPCTHGDLPGGGYLQPDKGIHVLKRSKAFIL